MTKVEVYINSDNEFIKMPYQQDIVGGMNKILSRIENSGDKNNSHDSFDIFNLSTIFKTEYLGFNKIKLIDGESHFIISHPDPDFIKKIINVIKNDKNIIRGFSIYKLVLKNESIVDSLRNRFFVNGVILKHDSLDVGYKQNKYYTFHDPDKCNMKMKRLIMKKLDMTKEHFKSINKPCPVNFTENDFNIYFDTTYTQKRTVAEKKSLNDKYFYIKNICPIIIEGNPTIVNFISTVGVGNFTKQGYGRIL